MEDMFDKDITVINKCPDKNNKRAKYKVSYIKGFWSSSNGISINGTHLINENTLMAGILMRENGYQSPEDFKKEIKKLSIKEINFIPIKEINSLPILFLSNKYAGWTLQKGDYLVKGKIKDFKNISDLLEQNQDVMKITNIAVKDYGSEDMWHFAVTGG